MARRPLTARSVLASVLLGTEPPWLPTPLLVATATLFDLREGAVRTALSRMVAAGEAVPERGGYALSGALLERQAEQLAGRTARRRGWDGTWELCVVDPGPRPAARRAELRRALLALHLAEWREGVWARPDNLDPDRSPRARAQLASDVQLWHGARPDPPHEDACTGPTPAPGGWDLAGWASVAAGLVEELPPLHERLASGDTSVLAEGFVTSATVLRCLRADPLLPDEMLPAAWPGRALRDAYDRFDEAYRKVLAGWFDEHRTAQPDPVA